MYTNDATVYCTEESPQLNMTLKEGHGVPQPGKSEVMESKWSHMHMRYEAPQLLDALQIRVCLA